MDGSPFDGMGQPAQKQRGKPLDIELRAAVTIDDLMRGKTNVRMPDGKQVSVSIPPEADDRQVIRLKGKGKSAPGRQAGDALITLIFKQDPVYQKHGSDLRTDFAVPLETAVLGGKVTVSTPDGKLALSVPSGTSSGKVFRLKGKGLPKKSGGFGDLLLLAALKLPDEQLDKLKAFFTSNSV